MPYARQGGGGGVQDDVRAGDAGRGGLGGAVSAPILFFEFLMV